MSLFALALSSCTYHLVRNTVKQFTWKSVILFLQCIEWSLFLCFVLPRDRGRWKITFKVQSDRSKFAIIVLAHFWLCRFYIERCIGEFSGLRNQASTIALSKYFMSLHMILISSFFFFLRKCENRGHHFVT